MLSFFYIFRLPTTHEAKGAMVGCITDYDPIEKCGTIEHTVTFTSDGVVSK